MSDLGIIAMHYNERIMVDDVCRAFVQAQLFQEVLFAV